MPNLMVDYNIVDKPVPGAYFTLPLFASELRGLHVGDVVLIAGDSADDEQARITGLRPEELEATLQFL